MLKKQSVRAYHTVITDGRAIIKPEKPARVSRFFCAHPCLFTGWADLFTMVNKRAESLNGRASARPSHKSFLLAAVLIWCDKLDIYMSPFYQEIITLCHGTYRT